MKLILTICLALLGAATALAVQQYDVNANGIRVNENMSVTIHVSGNNLFKNYDKFGFYVQNADGSYRNQTFSIADAQGKKFDFGDFAAGEEIKLYVVKGDNVFSDFSLSDKNGELVDVEFFDRNGKTETKFKFHVDGGAPSGQPLPGVIAALLLGGGALGARRFLKKSPQAK